MNLSEINIKILAIGLGAVLLICAVGGITSRLLQLIDAQRPESAPRNFVHGLVSRSCTHMLDHVCGSFVCPTLPNIAFEIRDESYTVLENDGKNARVRTYVDIRAKSKIGEIKIELGEVVLEVTKPGSRWCVQKGANLEKIIQAFVESVVK